MSSSIRHKIKRGKTKSQPVFLLGNRARDRLADVVHLIKPTSPPHLHRCTTSADPLTPAHWLPAPERKTQRSRQRGREQLRVSVVGCKKPGHLPF